MAWGDTFVTWTRVGHAMASELNGPDRGPDLDRTVCVSDFIAHAQMHVRLASVFCVYSTVICQTKCVARQGV